MVDKLGIQITMEDNTWLNIRLTLFGSQWSRQAIITGFSLDLDNHKNKCSHHRSFLHECDRSPEMHVLKLGIEIPNFKKKWLVYEIDLKILSPGVQLCVRKD